MTTVIRGRNRPIRSSGIHQGGSEAVLMNWIERRAWNILRRQTFALELGQGIVTMEEIGTFQEVKAKDVETMVRFTKAQIELYKSEDDGGLFQAALDKAVETNDLDFDFAAWDQSFMESLTAFQNHEVVFFRNRTTAFTLSRPCPNCGQKKMIAESSVFTRSADEAASQFATCRNCSSRFRLQTFSTVG